MTSSAQANCPQMQPCKHDQGSLFLYNNTAVSHSCLVRSLWPDNPPAVLVIDVSNAQVRDHEFELVDEIHAS